MQHEGSVFASSFSASNYHCHQLESANYQPQTPELNGFNNRLFHQVNGYRSGPANHHHLHHHLHQQTYHLIINNTPTAAANADSAHYHLDHSQSDAAGILTNSNVVLPFQSNDLSDGPVQSENCVRKSCDQQPNALDPLNQENRVAHYVQNAAY